MAGVRAGVSNQLQRDFNIASTCQAGRSHTIDFGLPERIARMPREPGGMVNQNDGAIRGANIQRALGLAAQDKGDEARVANSHCVFTGFGGQLPCGGSVTALAIGDGEIVQGLCLSAPVLGLPVRLEDVVVHLARTFHVAAQVTD